MSFGGLACPECKAALDGDLVCENGHRFERIQGVPALASTGQEIHESFSDEWAAFGTELSKTWGQETEQRLRDFREQLGYLNLEGKRVWDAGCGPALLSDAITTLGCDVVASDISDSVFAAARRFADNPRLTFVQADLARPVFQPESFDVIFCAGVLHHTPDTRKTLEAVLPALKPGGTIFVWLYWAVPGWKFKLRSSIRSAVVPMPLFVRKAVSYAYVPLVALKGRDGHSLRELAVVSLDYFTPKYRHEHTPEELGRWFRELGLSGITTSETGVNGFGVRATLPLSTPLGVRTTHRATA